MNTSYKFSKVLKVRKSINFYINCYKSAKELAGWLLNMDKWINNKESSKSVPESLVPCVAY